MPNNYFQFKQFLIRQDRSAMKVTTDACLFGAWAGNEVRHQGLNSQILDIGTGTGLLALMMAQKTKAAVTAIEIDKDAFEQATANIAASPWANRIKVIHSDARNFSFPHKYDIIISNPPFYENELKTGDKKKNTAHHGDDLNLSQLLTVIKKNLVADGIFYLLLPYKRSEEIKKLITQHEFFIQQMVFLRQSVKHDYFRMMIAGKLKYETSPTLIAEIAVKDEQDRYTGQFIELLGEYYSTL